jgi:hypothetical protein
MFHMTDMILELDDGAKVRTTSDGYMAAMPRVARTGIQLYRGREVGRADKDVVRIYRSEDEVFKRDSVSTFVGKPFTNNHPTVPVNAANWKDYSVGITGEDILRDGQFVRVPMVLMDGNTIKKVQAGKTQLSVGYTCDIKWGEGTTPDGETYDGRQVDIVVNHVAIVDIARGGDKLAIGDATKISDIAKAGVAAIRAGKVNDLDLLVDGEGVTCLLDKTYPFLKNGQVYSRALRDAKTTAQAGGDTSVLLVIDMLLELITDNGKRKEQSAMKTLIVDGITCEMSDTAVEVVQRAIKKLEDAAAVAAKKFGESEEDYQKRLKETGDAVAKLTTEGATKDAKIATLETQLKDSAMTPEKLDALVKDRALVADKAKALLPTVVVDGKSVEDIRAQVVTSKMGDVAKGWDASQIKVSFDTLTAGVQVDSRGVTDVARSFSQPPASVQDSEKRYDSYDAAISNAWKGPAHAKH